MCYRSKIIYGRVSRLLAAVTIFLLVHTACSSGKQQTNQAGPATPADLEAINQLHQRDMEASKTWDVEALVSLWTDDIVSIPPDGKPIIGKDANRNSLLMLIEVDRDIEVVEYNMTFNEVKVIGDWAFEWGTFSGTIRSKTRVGSEDSSGKFFRVLKRDADGSWKVARAMYNNDSADDSDAESSE